MSKYRSFKTDVCLALIYEYGEIKRYPARKLNIFDFLGKI